jgi:exonuclease-1
LKVCRKRTQSKAAGLELLKLGRSSQAHLELQKSIDVTPMMARHIIDACSAAGVKCLVAPYEADSQLYYLEKTGIIDGVVSEDSDLLVFGAKCLITKLDQFGECVEVNRSQFTACKDASLVGWTDKQFRHMCILSGCDYLENIPNMGLKTAHRLMKRHKDVDKVVRALQFDGKMVVPKGYLDAFWKADLTFQHQRVFCPIQDRLVMVNDPEPEMVLGDEILVYIGPETDLEVARGVARGELDPMTKEPIRVITAVPKAGHFTPARWPKLGTPVKNKSIKEFFKPKPGERQPVARTPLRSTTANVAAVFNSMSAPGRTQSTPSTKRPITTSTSSVTKKPRLEPMSLYEDDMPKTGERSSFFQGPKHRQIRQPISTPTPKQRSEGSNESTLKAEQNAAEDREKTLDPGSRAESEQQRDDPVAKVAESWKTLYSFKPSLQGGTALSAIIEKQRHGAPVKRMTPLQRLGAQSLFKSRRTVSAPLLSRPGLSAVSDSSQSQEEWPEFVGVGAFGSQRSSECSGSPSQETMMVVSSGGKGMFDRFSFHGRQ